MRIMRGLISVENLEQKRLKSKDVQFVWHLNRLALLSEVQGSEVIQSHVTTHSLDFLSKRAFHPKYNSRVSLKLSFHAYMIF